MGKHRSNSASIRRGAVLAGPGREPALPADGRLAPEQMGPNLALRP